VVLALSVALCVICSGWAVLRFFGEQRCLRTLGLAPAAGLAVLVLPAGWAALLHLPLPLIGVPYIGLAACGLVDLIHSTGMRALRQHALGAFGLLALSLGIAVVVQVAAFGHVLAPLSPQDGAFHAQIIDLLRTGTTWQPGWYPPGLHAAFAALLQMVPSVDSALGSFWLAMGLGLLLPLAVFGLGCSVWQCERSAAWGAMLATLSYQASHLVQLWSGWPFLASTLMMLGTWTVSAQYIHRPSVRRALLAGMFGGGMLLTHGTELYTTAVVLAITAFGSLTMLPWRRLAGHVPLAAGAALLGAAPYLPMLVHWAGTGGASAVGSADLAETQARGSTPLAELVVTYGADVLGLDLPVRIALLGTGAILALRYRHGRVLIASAAGFAGLAALFRFASAEPVQRLYAGLFPWGQHVRLMAIAAIPLAMLAGRGVVAFVTAVACVDGHAGLRARLTRRGLTLLIATWLVLASWALVAYLSILTHALSSVSGDDVRAMDWLRAHAAPGEVLANDRGADAGIWSPFKSGVAVVLPAIVSDEPDYDRRRLVLAHVGQLADSPPARAAACALHVRYVYSGAANSAWQRRHFPSASELRQSWELDEAFASGDAVVFLLRDWCEP
jgi:hypothetical protein